MGGGGYKRLNISIILMAFDELPYAVEYWLPRGACREGYKYYDNSIENCTIKFHPKLLNYLVSQESSYMQGRMMS